MNIYLLLILIILLGNYILNLVIELLNAASAKGKLPAEFQGWYDSQKYKKSQDYLKENTHFKIIQATIMLLVVLFLILSGGFNFIDKLARGFGLAPIPTGLVFAGVLFFGLQLIEIPFSLYHTFVIEEKYGFNRTAPKTFILDILKGWLLALIIGGVVFAAIIWFFTKTGSWAWVWCWIAVTLFEVFLIFIAPVVIMPLFNKFIPLPEGELKQAIQDYAKSQGFALKGVFKMDGSRRSTKANAFFTGFGKYRRIVLFDTLIEKQTQEELVSVLAHEVGHYKRKHIFKHMLIATVSNGLTFFILSLFINNPGLFAAFRMENLSIYASLIFFSFLYTPIAMIFSIFLNFVSRRHEYEADSYAVHSYNRPEAFVFALKKLTVDNLSNLTPHPLKVFFHYSHPPVLQRIKAIKKLP